jgi:hypothetical protein
MMVRNYALPFSMQCRCLAQLSSFCRVSRRCTQCITINCDTFIDAELSIIECAKFKWQFDSARSSIWSNHHCANSKCVIGHFSLDCHAAVSSFCKHVVFQCNSLRFLLLLYAKQAMKFPSICISIDIIINHNRLSCISYRVTASFIPNTHPLSILARFALGNLGTIYARATALGQVRELSFTHTQATEGVTAVFMH